VANHFAQHLSPVTSLYRWSGPALLAFFLLNNDADAVKRNWAKAAAVKHEVNLDSKQRAVFVFVETVMSFQVVSQGTPTLDLFRNLDRFVAERSEASSGEE
jgi:hypothetical protein